jgi:predicted Zn-dependent peptidase
VKKKQIFEDVDAFITGNIDAGLVVISGRPVKGISLEDAEKYLWEKINKFKTQFISDNELQKSINSLEFSIGHLKTNIMAKTRLLGYYEMIDDAERINKEQKIYSSITKHEIKDAANRIFRNDNVSVLYYYADK